MQFCGTVGIIGGPLKKKKYITYLGWKVMQPPRGSRPEFYAIQECWLESQIWVR